jgi:hypothetical protein
MDRKKLQELIKSIIKETNTGGGATSGFTTGVGYQHQGKKPKDESKNYQKVPKDGKGVPTVFTKGAKDLSAYKNLGYREVKPSEMIDAAYLWAGKGGLKEEVNRPDVIRLNIPLFLRLLEYAKENAKTDMDLHRVTENVIKLSQLGKTLIMADYDKIIGSTEELNEGRYSQFKKQTEVVKPSSQMHTALKEVFKRLKEANKVASYTKQLKNDLSENNDIAYTKRSEAVISKLMEETVNLYKKLKEIKNGKSKS